MTSSHLIIIHHGKVLLNVNSKALAKYFLKACGPQNKEKKKDFVTKPNSAKKCQNISENKSLL